MFRDFALRFATRIALFLLAGGFGAVARAQTVISGTYNGVTIEGDIVVLPSTTAYFSKGTTFTGSNATIGTGAQLYWLQTGSLEGKTLNFATGSSLVIYGPTTASASLTLGPTTTVTGTVQITDNFGTGMILANQGTITHSGGTGSIAVDALTNTGSITATSGSLGIGNYDATTTNGRGGTIVADGPNAIVSLNGIIDNQGTLIARNSGQLVFRNAYPVQTTATLGAVQIATGGHVYLGSTLNNTSATLTSPTGGSYELYGGSIFNGAIEAGALGYTSAGGTLYNVQLAGNLDLAAGATVTFAEGTVFPGPAANLGANSSWGLQQSGTLSDKLITFGLGAEIYLQGKNATLTIGPTTTATGAVKIRADGSDGIALSNQGTILHSSGSGLLNASAFSNTGNITATSGSQLGIGTSYYAGYTTTNAAGGTITADGPNTVITLDGKTVNQGTLIARNSGQIVFQTLANLGQTSATLGTIQIANGGHVYLGGTLDNMGATLTAPAGGSFELYGGTINNGTIAAGALSFTASGGFLGNVSLLGDFTLQSGTSLSFNSGTSFSGTNATLGNDSALTWQQIGTLDGKSFNFGSGSNIYVGGNNALTLGPSTVVSGNVRISAFLPSGGITNQGSIVQDMTNGNGVIYGAAFLNTGSIRALANSTLAVGNFPGNYTTTNGSGGTIAADGANARIELLGNFINRGTLIAQNSGQIMFNSGPYTPQQSVNLGTVQIAGGGHVYLAGTLDNTGTTLTAPVGGSFELYGGTINGGVIAPGALTYTVTGGTLNNVTLAGDLTLPAGTQVGFSGGTTFTGTNMTLESSTTVGSSSQFRWLQSGTLDGKALNFGTNSLLTVGDGNSLTLGPASRMSGSVSMLSNNSGSTIINQGTITHSAGDGRVYAQTFTNSGSIVVTGGQLVLGSSFLSGWTFTNSAGGLIQTTGGGTVNLTAPGSSQIINNGKIDVQGGAVDTHDHLTNGAGGVISGGGTILHSLTMAGGTIAPGNSVGTLGFVFGTLNVTGASVFAVELGGVSSDQLVFNNPPSAVSLGTGLLTLSLTLLAPPTPNTTYNLIQISSGGSGITGTFAGLPSSGNTITAVYADTTYTFGVNYATNLVSLNFATIPEPSTYVLLGAGTVLLALWRRRR